MLPYLVLGGAQIAVGAAAIFARYALGGAGPLAVSAARLAIAAAVLLCVTPVLRPSRPRPALTRSQQGILALAGLALAAHFATWIWSLEYTSVAVSVLLVATTPIWTAIYDAVFRNHRLSPLALAAFAGGALGIIMVVGRSAAPAPVPGYEGLGAALALAGSLFVGAYLLLIREVRARLDTLAIVRHTFSWAALALVAGAFVARQPVPPASDARAWLGILAMALVSQLLGHTALNASLRWFSPSSVAFATLLEPLIAAGLAFVLFGESLSGTALAGGLILLASVAVVMREERFDLDAS